MRARDVHPESSGVIPISGTWAANVGRALRETLEAFASEAVAADILLNALVDGGYDVPPERADDLEEFANGALRTETAAVLGDEVADAVVEGLGAVLQMMRRSESEQRLTLPELADGPPTLQAVHAVPVPPVAHAGAVHEQAGVATSRSDHPSVAPRSTPRPGRPSLGPRPTSRPGQPAVFPRPTSRPDMPAVAPRPTSRPDLAAVSSRSAIAMPPHLMGLAARTSISTPPEERVTAVPELPMPAPVPRALSSVPAPRVPRPQGAGQGELRARAGMSTPPAQRFVGDTNDVPSPQAPALLDLVVVTHDEELTAVVGLRFASRRVAVGTELGALPRARVALVDTRHALDALRSSWPASSAPHVAVLWPADARERALFEAMQPHVPRVVCAGEEAEFADLMMLVGVQLTPR